MCLKFVKILEQLKIIIIIIKNIINTITHQFWEAKNKV